MYDKNNEINNIKSEVDMSIPNSKDFLRTQLKILIQSLCSHM